MGNNAKMSPFTFQNRALGNYLYVAALTQCLQAASKVTQQRNSYVVSFVLVPCVLKEIYCHIRTVQTVQCLFTVK